MLKARASTQVETCRIFHRNKTRNRARSGILKLKCNRVFWPHTRKHCRNRDKTASRTAIVALQNVPDRTAIRHISQCNTCRFAIQNSTFRKTERRVLLHTFHISPIFPMTPSHLQLHAHFARICGQTGASPRKRQPRTG